MLQSHHKFLVEHRNRPKCAMRLKKAHGRSWGNRACGITDLPRQQPATEPMTERVPMADPDRRKGVGEQTIVGT